MSTEGHRLMGSTSELVYSTAHKIAMPDLMIFAYISLSFLVLISSKAPRYVVFSTSRHVFPLKPK
jgi:hypothetical protein